MISGRTETHVDGLEIIGGMSQGYAEILTPASLQFAADLAREFNPEREALLRRREEQQQKISAGQLPDFLLETAEVREGDWTVAPLPHDLQDRRVEITGPSGDRKMVINALNSGAKVFMADFEDALSPTWENIIEGQINMRDAVRRTISFQSPEGKSYSLNNETATLIVRPRGWHLVEKHVLLDGEPMPGGIFDFALYFFHNARESLERGSGPYFYLPKLESHLEARLWNNIFVRAQEVLGVPHGSIKATVLIETITAAFEMDEILYELRDHSSGLNCGRWDYIFSCIKKFRALPDFIYPDRAQVTMTTHAMRQYSLLAIKTCHRRNVHAMGGMSAFIPVKGNEEENTNAFAQVRADKEREAGDGHDGTWVAHPGLVAVALEVFNAHMPTPNQIEKKRDDVLATADDLLRVPDGKITEGGLRTNISVGVQYLAAWLNGVGAVPINNLMEDAATAEISRAQLWQWVHHPKGILEDGRKVTVELFREILGEELTKLRASVGDEAYERGGYKEAGALFDSLTVTEDFVEFLTLPAYEKLK